MDNPIGATGPQRPELAGTSSQKARPGDFLLGSVESRAAARAMAERKHSEHQLTAEHHRAITDPLYWMQHLTRTRDSLVRADLICSFGNTDDSAAVGKFQF